MKLRLQTLNFFFFAGIVLLLVSCKSTPETHNGYSKEKDVYFKLITIGDGKIKPDSSQTLWIDISCKTLKDSVFWDSKHNSAQKFFVTQKSFPFYDHLFQYSVGDSLQYLVPTKEFYSNFFGVKKVAVFSEKDTCVKIAVKILQVLGEDELSRLKDSLFISGQQRKQEEFAQVKNYITTNFKKPISITSDAFMEITKITTLDSIKPGKRVKLSYKGAYLDGKVVDFTPDNRPFEFVMGHEDQILEGLRIALCRLKKGEKAKIILPSRLAFGSSGSSNGSIAPYSPLLYEVEVLDVK
ncbi:MAG: FKBP-type peptidyl-prolyl cis-trans isomerase [Bacteroidia bacterium]